MVHALTGGTEPAHAVGRANTAVDLPDPSITEPAKRVHPDRYNGPGLCDLEPTLTKALEDWCETPFVSAGVSCTYDHIDGNSCAWYHGPWSALRALDVVSGPSWHHDFYARALSTVMRLRGAKKVLICGAADFSVLAFVLAAATDRSELEIHILDQCATPLDSCQWYARRTNADITIHQRAVGPDLARRGTELFNLIVTDALLTRFAYEDARDLVAQWYTMLAPGGSVITTVRLHPRDQSVVTAQAKANFVERVCREAQQHGNAFKVTAPELTEAARVYVDKICSVDLGDVDRVTDLFTSAGFRMTSCDTSPTKGEIVPTEYAQIHARRLA